MTITIKNILDDITQQVKVHDEFIGLLFKKYNLPEDGTAKTSEYDELMIDVLVEVSDDIELRFNHIMAKYRGEDLDENAKIWLEGVEEKLEAFEAMHKSAKTIYILAMLDGLGM